MSNPVEYLFAVSVTVADCAARKKGWRPNGRTTWLKPDGARWSASFALRSSSWRCRRARRYAAQRMELQEGRSLRLVPFLAYSMLRVLLVGAIPIGRYNFHATSRRMSHGKLELFIVPLRFSAKRLSVTLTPLIRPFLPLMISP